jgi:cytidine deaminase
MPSASERRVISDSELMDAARSARSHAYAPYSHLSVGAALLCDDGTIHSGCNVESGSYGLTICAERNALFSAVANGRRSFSAIAVAGPPGARTSPCGACRQVLAEFAPAMRVLYTIPDGVEHSTVRDLLPDGFVF